MTKKFLAFCALGVVAVTGAACSPSQIANATGNKSKDFVMLPDERTKLTAATHANDGGTDLVAEQDAICAAHNLAKSEKCHDSVLNLANTTETKVSVPG